MTYLQWCIEQYYIYKCTEVVFIGDVIDNHFSSYHETSADGMGGADELEYAIKRIARWRNAFPSATVIIGNHDRIIMRKAQTSAIPSKWIKSYKEVLETPDWNFVERYVLYCKYGKKPAIGCSVVLNNGTLPINLLMPL
jgi:hypothetical protein